LNWLDPLYMVLAGATAPVWARKTRADWPARFGKIAPLEGDGRKRLLVHAVSVGEVNALRELVPLLTPRARVIVSVGTDTGIAQARKIFGGVCEVVRYPVDFSWAVRRFLDAVKPDAVALVELELWPNFVAACRKRGVPVCVINGRLSAKSFRGYRRLRPALRRVFGSLEFAAVQDATYAERFVHMGVARERCFVTGSMKWDTARVEDTVPGAEALAAEMGIERGPGTPPLVVAGSTAEGEESLLHRVCPEGVQLLCAPRKPERFDEAAAALPDCVRRSAGQVGGPGSKRFLLDTLGELRKAYALADVVVIGRTFGDMGGSDPIESIGLGKATVVGPSVKNFEEIVRLFEEAGGLVRAERENLGETIRALLADPARRREIAERGRAVIRSQKGASPRHAEMLLELIDAKA
jgi:3-deoxy-D-manno-octulosonic-acid transferase